MADQESSELIDAEFCLNEGGWGEIAGGRKISNDVQVSEKYVINFRFEVRNKGGHSSMPVPDNAIYHLAGALDRLSKFAFPLKTNDVTRAYFQAMSKIETGPMQADLAKGGRGLARRDAARGPSVTRVERHAAHHVRGDGDRRRPCEECTAATGGRHRQLPGASGGIRRIRAEHFEKGCGGRPGEPHDHRRGAKGPASPMRPDVFKAVNRFTDTMWPGVPAVPIMVMGATDGLYLRGIGIPTYGVQGFFMDRDDIRFHGRDERAPGAVVLRRPDVPV